MWGGSVQDHNRFITTCVYKINYKTEVVSQGCAVFFQWYVSPHFGFSHLHVDSLLRLAYRDSMTYAQPLCWVDIKLILLQSAIYFHMEPGHHLFTMILPASCSHFLASSKSDLSVENTRYMQWQLSKPLEALPANRQWTFSRHPESCEDTYVMNSFDPLIALSFTPQMVICLYNILLQIHSWNEYVAYG